MRLDDNLRLGLRSLASQRTRAALTLLAVALGTAAVILLSALGEGARRYVLDEFTQLGTHLLIVLPGRSETTGGPPPLLGETPRDLTIGDAIAITRSRLVSRVAPLVVGSVAASFGSRSRDVTIIGTTTDYLAVRQLVLAQGRFLPPRDPERGRPVAVVGEGLAGELFGQGQVLGRWMRLGDRRFRVIGVLQSSGESLGMDLRDIAIIPVASAQILFDSPALFRILVQARSRSGLPAAKEAIVGIVRERHEGEDDVTVIAQDAMLATFDRILNALTFSVAGIASISLLVAGVLIMNVMLVAVSQRTPEVGLLKALGADDRQILRLFLTEAVLLAGSGTVAGLLLSALGLYLFNSQVDAFRMLVPLWAPAAAIAVSLLAGLVFGLLPAVRAARLDPVVALTGR